MLMSEKNKKNCDSCRFCWMCHHICPIGNATGQERNTARARMLGVSLVNRKALELGEIIDNIYECAGCGGCISVCTTGWDPVSVTKETRLQAALEGKLPPYIQKMVDACLQKGNAYGKELADPALLEKIRAHKAKTSTLLFLGSDARLMAPGEAVKAIRVLEKAGIPFTVLEDEPESGAQLDFLIGGAEETKEAIAAAAKAAADFETVVFYDPQDLKVQTQVAREAGLDGTKGAVSFPKFVAGLIKEGKLKANPSKKEVVFQDPFQLARDLGETEEAREVISAYATLSEMLLNRKETVWAGNILMASYMPDVMKKVASRRIFNARTIGKKSIVTASVGENAALKGAGETDVEILSLEDLILA